MHQQTDGDEELDDCMQAKVDAEKNAGGSPGYFFLGLACGLIGFIIAVSQNPSPPVEDLVGKSDEYVVCYTSTYQNKKKKKNTTTTCVGWVVGAAVVMVWALTNAE